MSLLSRLAIPILAGAVLFSPLRATAQEKPQKASVSLGVGAYSSLSESIRDVYGPMIRFKVGGELNLSDKLQVGLSTGFMSKKGNIYIYSTKYSGPGNLSGLNLSLLQLDAFARYQVPLNKISVYFGGGLNYTFARQRESLSDLRSDDTTANSFGFSGHAGVNFHASTLGDFYLELSGGTSQTRWDWGGEVGENDFGGFCLEVGIRPVFR